MSQNDGWTVVHVTNFNCIFNENLVWTIIFGRVFFSEFQEYPSNICFGTKAICWIKPYDLIMLTWLSFVCLGVTGFWNKCNNVVMETTLSEYIWIWYKVFKNGSSELCGRQSLKNLKWYGLPKYYSVHSWMPWPKYLLKLEVVEIGLESF